MQTTQIRIKLPVETLDRLDKARSEGRKPRQRLKRPDMLAALLDLWEARQTQTEPQPATSSETE